MRSCFVFTFVRLPGCSPAEPECRGSLPAAVPAACEWHVPRGQWALLDADMSQLIDRSSCLVEPCVPVPAASTTDAASGRRSRVPIARPCRRSCRSRAASSELLCHCCRFTATASSTLLFRGVLAARVRAHFACSPGRRRLDVSSCARHRLSVTFEMLGRVWCCWSDGMSSSFWILSVAWRISALSLETVVITAACLVMNYLF